MTGRTDNVKVKVVEKIYTLASDRTGAPDGMLKNVYFYANVSASKHSTISIYCIHILPSERLWGNCFLYCFPQISSVYCFYHKLCWKKIIILFHFDSRNAATGIGKNSLEYTSLTVHTSAYSFLFWKCVLLEIKFSYMIQEEKQFKLSNLNYE